MAQHLTHFTESLANLTDIPAGVLLVSGGYDNFAE